MGRLELKGLSAPVDVVRSVNAGDEDRGETTETASNRPASGARSRRRSRGLVLTAIVLAVAAIAVPIVILSNGDDGAASSTSPTAVDLGYRPTYEQRPCEKDAIDGQTCGVLHVPERRDQPNGKRDQVAVAEFTPVSPGTRATVTVGAIGPASDPVPRFGATLFQMTRRGEAGEPTLNCPEISAAAVAHIDEPLMAASPTLAYLDAVSRSADRWDQQGVDRSSYGAADVADDIRDLVIAKHLPPVDLVVSSDDTPVALDLMRGEPGILRTVTFENPIPPNSTPGDYISAYAEALDNFSTVCKQDSRCSKYLPDPVGAWTAMYQRLQSAPQRIDGPLPDGSQASVLVDGDRAASVFATAIGIATLTPYVPQILSTGAVGQIAYNARDRSGVQDKPYGQDLTDLCERVAPLDRPGDRYIATIQPQFVVGIWNFARLARACDTWNVTPDSDRSRQPVTSKIPVLIASGALAPSVRQDKVDAIGTGFTNKVSFRFPTLGFGVLHAAPSCFQQYRLAWLKKPTSVPDRSHVEQCEKTSPAIGFYG